MQNVLITGYTGCVGRNLIAYNSKGNEFTQLLMSRIKMSSRKSISNSFKSVDAVVPLARKAHDLKGSSQVSDYYKVNYELTTELYDAFISSEAKKFIFVSSVKAAADSLECILSEDYSPDPKTHYGKSKLQAEQYIQNQLLPK